MYYSVLAPQNVSQLQEFCGKTGEVKKMIDIYWTETRWSNIGRWDYLDCNAWKCTRTDIWLLQPHYCIWHLIPYSKSQFYRVHKIKETRSSSLLLFLCNFPQNVWLQSKLLLLCICLMLLFLGHFLLHNAGVQQTGIVYRWLAGIKPSHCSLVMKVPQQIKAVSFISNGVGKLLAEI